MLSNVKVWIAPRSTGTDDGERLPVRGRVGRIVPHAPSLGRRAAEQTMGMPATKRWTAEEVRAMQEEERAWPRYELIDGELLVTLAPS